MNPYLQIVYREVKITTDVYMLEFRVIEHYEDGTKKEGDWTPLKNNMED